MSRQQHLFLCRAPLARTSDPDSSHEAAERVVSSGTAAGHERLILAVLTDAGKPLTAKVIARHGNARPGNPTELDSVKVCRRLGPTGRLRDHDQGPVRYAGKCPDTGEQMFALRWPSGTA